MTTLQAQREQCYEGRDEELDAFILDEDKVQYESHRSDNFNEFVILLMGQRKCDITLSQQMFDL